MKKHLLFLFTFFVVGICVSNAQTFKDHYNEAVGHFQNGDFVNAIAALDKAIALNNTDADAYFNRALSKAMLDNQSGAIKDYSKAIELNPQFIDAWYNRGIARSYLFDRQGVIEDMTAVLKLDPNYANAWGLRGQTYFDLKEEAKGCRDLKMAYDLGYKQPESQIRLYCNDPPFLTVNPTVEHLEIDFPAGENWKPMKAEGPFCQQKTPYQSAMNGEEKVTQTFFAHWANFSEEETLEMIQKKLLPEATKAKLVELAQEDGGKFSATFFVKGLKNEGESVSELWLVKQGEKGLYVLSVQVAGKRYPEEQKKKWLQIFANSKLVVKPE